MKRGNFLLIVQILLFTNGFALEWPIMDGSTPQHLTSTFGEWREASPLSSYEYYQVDHFHDGVDMVPIGQAALNTYVWGVEYNDLCWVVGTNHVRSDYHDFFHITPLCGVGDELHPQNSVGQINTSGDPPHLHINSRQYRQSMSTAYHCHHPWQSTWYRFDPLYEDEIKPKINTVIFTDDGDYSTVHQADELPANTNIDIVVDAEEVCEYYDHLDSIDDNNGIYKIGYNINSSVWQYNLEFYYFEQPDYWDLSFVFDDVRQVSNSVFWYVVTNTMDANGYWNTGSPGLKVVYIEAKDERNNANDLYTINVSVVTGIEEENVHRPHYQNDLNAILPNPVRDKIKLNYQIANPTATKITIFDCSGRIVKSIVINDDPGNHTVIWDGVDTQGREVTNGCYFVKFEAGDYKVTKKFILVK